MMGHSPGRGPRRAAIIDAMATFTGPVTGGTIIEPACLTQCDLASHGYVEEEFFADGEACGYDLAGETASDGAWTAVAAESAPFRTRLVVRRPAGQGRFGGLLETFSRRRPGRDAQRRAAVRTARRYRRRLAVRLDRAAC